MIPVLILQADAEGAWLTVAYVANWLIWAVFAIELAVILYVAQRRWAALRAHWLDVPIVILTVPIVSSPLGWGRLARFVRSRAWGHRRAHARTRETVTRPEGTHAPRCSDRCGACSRGGRARRTCRVPASDPERKEAVLMSRIPGLLAAPGR